MSIFGQNTHVSAEVARAARWAKPDGVVMGYYPAARMNPYQALIYGSALEFGIHPVPLYNPTDIPAITAARAFDARTVLHLHWTSDILRECVSREDALDRTDEFHSTLDEALDAGVTLVWTIHNTLPHVCPFPDVESRLRGGIVERAAAIHIMNPDTPRLVSDLYPLASTRTLVVPHPSYRGYYPRSMSRQLARFELGYRDEDLVVASVGSIQAYKGLPELAEAFESVRKTNMRLRLLIAGMPGGPTGSEVLDALSESYHLDLVPRRLSDRDIAEILLASDAVALPYAKSLNSGVAELAVAFERPLLVPDTSAFGALVDEGLGTSYDSGSQASLETGLLRLPEFIKAYDPTAAQRWANDLAPTKVSRELLSAIRSLADGA